MQYPSKSYIEEVECSVVYGSVYNEKSRTALLAQYRLETILSGSTSNQSYFCSIDATDCLSQPFVIMQI